MSRSYNKPSTPKSNGRRQVSNGEWWEAEPEKDAGAVSATVAKTAEVEEIPWWEKPSYQNLAQRQAAAAAAQGAPTSPDPTTALIAVATGTPTKETTATPRTPPRSPAPSSSKAGLPQKPKSTKSTGNWWDREPEADVKTEASTPATKSEPASPSPKAGKRAPGGVMAACAVAASSASTGKNKAGMTIKEPVQTIGVPRVSQLTASSPPSPPRTSARSTRQAPTSPTRSSAFTRTKPNTPGQGKSKAKGEKKWWMEDRSAEPAQPVQGEAQTNWWDRPCLLNGSGTSGPPSLTSSTASATSASGKSDKSPSTPPVPTAQAGLSIKGAALAAKLAKLELAADNGAGAGGSEKVLRRKASWEEEVKKAEVFAGVDWSEME
ncbi:hypothetical protein IAT38_005386 [Cryptococcus sp. DSM 104549]